jgi:prepilin-type N-terminal cleavage/methylation domain-containing protein
VRNRASFTLIETIISVALLGIIFTYLYSTIDTLKRSDRFYKEKLFDFQEKQKIVKVLYSDLILANSKIDLLQADSKEFSTLKIKTLNSLYNIANPTVIWYVSKDNTLCRVESTKDINLPLKFDNIKYSFIDRIKSDIELFRVFSSKKSSSLVYIESKKGEEIIFEVKNYYSLKDKDKSKNSSNATNRGKNDSNSSSSFDAPPSLPGQ